MRPAGRGGPNTRIMAAAMPPRTRKTPHARREAAPPRRRILPRSMWLVLAVALFLRGVRLDGVIGGFHDHNEANYTLMASHFTPKTLFFPNPDGRLFLETPPLYAWLLALLFQVTGVSVVSARLLTIFMGLGLVLATFLLARRLFDERAGVAAAALVAVSPVAVLTGRNIQTDTLLAFLSVLAVLFYARAQSEEGTRGDAILFGAAHGLAGVTNRFAVVRHRRCCSTGSTSCATSRGRARSSSAARRRRAGSRPRRRSGRASPSRPCGRSRLPSRCA
jgi:hypothetical protein